MLTKAFLKTVYMVVSKVVKNSIVLLDVFSYNLESHDNIQSNDYLGNNTLITEINC